MVRPVSGAAQGFPKKSDDYCQVLVVTLRHRRSDFAVPIQSWVRAKATFEPLGYEMLRQGPLALALDRAILASRPEVLQVRLLSFLHARDGAPVRVADLPDDLREAMVDEITHRLPGTETRASARANTVTARVAAPFRLKVPAGTGATLRIESYPPPEALPSLARLPAVEDPTGSPRSAIDAPSSAELRLFRPGRWAQGNILVDWDALRPLVKEREDAAVKRAEEELRAVNDEASRWIKGELGVRKGEDTSYSLLTENAKEKVRKLTGKTDDALVGTQVRAVAGTPMIHYFSESSGSTWIELKLVSR